MQVRDDDEARARRDGALDLGRVEAKFFIQLAREPCDRRAEVERGRDDQLVSRLLDQHFVAGFFEAGNWQEYLGSLIELYRDRRDVMLEALAEHFPPEATWTRPQGGLFLWATLPDYIDTTDLLARALRDNVAFVPGRAAYLDGRGGSSMRLNFSGVSEDDLHEGVRRIGHVVREQVSLYSTLTGLEPVAPRSANPQAGNVVPFRRAG